VPLSSSCARFGATMKSSLRVLVFFAAFFVLLQASSQAKYGKSRPKGNPGPPNSVSGDEDRTCKLMDKGTGAIFDLSAPFKLNKYNKKMFVIEGASGGPFDHVDRVYDYHFALCGATPPQPLDCMGSDNLVKSPVYQITRRKDISEEAKKEQTYKTEPEKDTMHNCLALGSGDPDSWTYSLINKNDPSYGIQIDYKDGQECLKRTVVRTRTDTGREKREVKWIPTPRSTTIKMTCNPQTMNFDQTGESKQSGDISRIVGQTQTVHAVEDDMCHYTLTWDSPYGCPTNKKIRSVADRANDDTVVTQDASGRYQRTTRRKANQSQFMSTVVKLGFFMLLAAAAVVGIQVWRHWKWMRIILPQMSDPNPMQQRLARKKFLKLIQTFGNPKQGMAPSGSRLV